MQKLFRHVTDERMFKVMEYIIAHEVRAIATQKDWCAIIGIAANNLPNIRSGKQSFSIDHIRECCVYFNVSANYIFGLSNEVFRQEKKENPVLKLKAAVAEVEAMMKAKKSLK